MDQGNYFECLEQISFVLLPRIILSYSGFMCPAFLFETHFPSPLLVPVAPGWANQCMPLPWPRRFIWAWACDPSWVNKIQFQNDLEKRSRWLSCHHGNRAYLRVSRGKQCSAMERKDLGQIHDSSSKPHLVELRLGSPREDVTWELWISWG